MEIVPGFARPGTLPGLHAIPLTGSREAAPERPKRSGGWRAAAILGRDGKARNAPPENSRVTAIAASRSPVSRIALKEGRAWPV